MIDPLVSIILPVYNREDVIEETIKCAINQTYRNIELIISDNCSTDNTWKILEKYAKIDGRIRIIKTEKNLGPVLNWKNCLDNVSGEYTKILWSDDLISHDFVEKTLGRFDYDTAFVMTGVNVFGLNFADIKSKTKYQIEEEFSTSHYLKDILIYEQFGFPVSPCCAIFRTKDLLNSYMEEIPNQDNLEFKRFGAGNDLLLFLLTTRGYKKIKCVPEILTFYRSHPSSLTVSNKLDLYYEYSKLFFVVNHFSSESNLFKAKIFFKLIRYKRYKNVYNIIEGELSPFILIKYLFKKIYFSLN
jgi:glycosyltransferase involved in cell wall biosynthesis